MILHNVCKCKAKKSPKITSIALLRKTSAVEGSCLRKYHWFITSIVKVIICLVFNVSLLCKICVMIWVLLDRGLSYIVAESFTVLNCSWVEYVVHCSHRHALDWEKDVSLLSKIFHCWMLLVWQFTKSFKKENYDYRCCKRDLDIFPINIYVTIPNNFQLFENYRRWGKGCVLLP